MRLSSTDNKRGLDQHQKRVARVESWLDLGVLKALGEEVGLKGLVNAEDGTSQRWLFSTGLFTTHLG